MLIFSYFSENRSRSSTRDRRCCQECKDGPRDIPECYVWWHLCSASAWPHCERLWCLLIHYTAKIMAYLTSYMPRDISWLKGAGTCVANRKSSDWERIEPQNWCCGENFLQKTKAISMHWLWFLFSELFVPAFDTFLNKFCCPWFNQKSCQPVISN